MVCMTNSKSACAQFCDTRFCSFYTIEIKTCSIVCWFSLGLCFYKYDNSKILMLDTYGNLDPCGNVRNLFRDFLSRENIHSKSRFLRHPDSMSTINFIRSV